jgi:hypothetical protein
MQCCAAGTHPPEPQALGQRSERSQCTGILASSGCPHGPLHGTAVLPQPAVPSSTAAHPRTPCPSNLSVGVYFQGLSAAARIQRHAVTGTSQAARGSALQEFRQWLRAQVCIWDIYTCTPEDCCSYLTGYWLPKRGYQEDASGKLIAGPAPVTVESMLSHLRRELDHLGREHE